MTALKRIAAIVDDVNIFAFVMPYSLAQNMTVNMKPVYKIESIAKIMFPQGTGTEKLLNIFAFIAKPIAIVKSKA